MQKAFHFACFIGIILVWNTNLCAQSGLHFDGTNDYIQIPNYIGIQGTTARTIEAWVKIPNSITGGSQPIAAWGSNTTNGAKWDVSPARQ